ncbi:MAG TPA: Trk family potassium uptake protein, partial [Firmicutes bacterium]|nr:Trk family potassium uptake protein [Bacillota bacterium]
LGVLLASVVSIIKGKRDTEIFRRRIATDAVFKAIAVIFMALSVVLLVTLVLSITEAAPFLNLLFEAMSAFGTVGLTTGITPTLSDIGRVLIIALMYIGRLGPLTLAVAIGQRHYPPSLHYPEERVMIG